MERLRKLSSCRPKTSNACEDEESDGQTLLATTTYPTQISNADVGGISKIFKDTFDFLTVRTFGVPERHYSGTYSMSNRYKSKKVSVER